MNRWEILDFFTSLIFTLYGNEQGVDGIGKSTEAEKAKGIGENKTRIFYFKMKNKLMLGEIYNKKWSSHYFHILNILFRKNVWF